MSLRTRRTCPGRNLQPDRPERSLSTPPLSSLTPSLECGQRPAPPRGGHGGLGPSRTGVWALCLSSLLFSALARGVPCEKPWERPFQGEALGGCVGQCLSGPWAGRDSAVTERPGPGAPPSGSWQQVPGHPRVLDVQEGGS